MDYFIIVSQSETQAVLQLKPNYSLQVTDNVITINTDYIIVTNPNSLGNYNFEGSTITSVNVNETVLAITSYSDLVTYIYTLINDGPKIISNTRLVVKTIEIVDPNYIYLNTIGIGYETDTTNNYIFEISNQSIINQIKINMNITLSNGTVINILIG
jgi:hypothetical protein